MREKERERERESKHQNYFPTGNTAAPRGTSRNFSPLISDGMIIRNDILRESGSRLNVGLLRPTRGLKTQKFHGIAEIDRRVNGE